MTLPTYRDYAEAVQNPGFSFQDQRLKSAQVVTTMLGTPQASTGGFAIAFQLRNGTHAWAVRCFTHDSADLGGRYGAISAFIRGGARPEFVEVDYLDDGVLVGGRWWPVTVMPWVRGMALNEWVQAHLGVAGALTSLRGRFGTLVARLEAHGAAHGDLQHGNVIVQQDGALTLIDYDGMFVPALAGRKMPEDGQPNYQHPQRPKASFGPGLDRFSAAVIWSALEVLDADPSYWLRYDNGENLLFRADDFARPEASTLIAELKGNAALAHVADRVARLSRAPIDRVPGLEDVIAGRLPTVVRREPETTADIAGLLPYQVVDLRRGDPSAFEGERVFLVGETRELVWGRTRFGDPYVFVPLGAAGRTLVKLVIWSNVLGPLGWNPAAGPRLGQVVGVTGMLTRYRGELQLELERPALFETLRSERVVTILGSPWSAPPPAKLRVTHPRIGDFVRHSIHGTGRVVGVKHDTVSIDFSSGVKPIQYTKFFLELVEPARPAAVGATGTPGPTPTTNLPPAAPTPGQPVGAGASPRSGKSKSTPAAGAHGSVPAAIAKQDADVLNALFGNAASPQTAPRHVASRPASANANLAGSRPKGAATSARGGREQLLPAITIILTVLTVAAYGLAGPDAALIVGAASVVGWVVFRYNA